MKLKLTNTELLSLYIMLQRIMQIDTHGSSMDDKLTFALLAKTYERFHIRSIISKKKHNIELPPAEALNWYIFFTERVKLPKDAYLQNLVRTINNQIHKQYQN